LCCYHAVGVTSKKHSKGGRKLLAACDTADTENEAPQVAPSIPHDLQVEFLVKFKLKLLNLSAVLSYINITVDNFSQAKLKGSEMLII
jgi:hypothetical protein